jgi:hypothetical protein
MALWQFDCYIVPRKNGISALNGEEILSWKRSDAFSVSIDFLEKQESWSKDIIQYGKDDETCIQFLYENGMLEEIHCRLDLRSLSKKMLEEILKFVALIDGVIFCEDRFCPPNIDNVAEMMRKSNANKFCQNPRQYFEEISGGVNS